MFSGQGRGERVGVGFVGVFRQQRGERGGRNFFQQHCGGLAAVRIHAHVERAGELDGEAACRIVNLHRGDAEVGEDQIRAGDFRLGEHLRQPREVAPVGGESFRAETKRAKTTFGLGQLNRIGIEAEQASGGLEAGEDFLRVSAVAERAIHRDLAGTRIQRGENFRDHDRTVHAGGSFTCGENFGDGFAIALWIAFLVFVLEATRIPAAVTGAAFVRGGRWIGHGLFGHRRGVCQNSAAAASRFCPEIQRQKSACYYFES